MQQQFFSIKNILTDKDYTKCTEPGYKLFRSDMLNYGEFYIALGSNVSGSFGL